MFNIFSCCWYVINQRKLITNCPNVGTLKSCQYQSQPGLTQLGNPLSFGRIHCLPPQALVLCWVPRGGLPSLMPRAHRACSTGRGRNWSTFAWLGLFGLWFVPSDLVSFKLLFSGLRTTTYHNKILFNRINTKGFALIWWNYLLLPSHWLSVCFSLGWGSLTKVRKDILIYNHYSCLSHVKTEKCHR